jgi:hypothetical protein
MTKKTKYFVRCSQCKEDLICPKCQQKTPRGTPFGNWLRELPSPLDSRHISNHNLDYIWHNYVEDWLITIEEKQHGGKSSKAQLDTHRVIFQLLRIASRTEQTIRLGAYRRRKGKVEYRGHYIISFENTTPDNSKWVTINGGAKIAGDKVKPAIINLLTTGKQGENNGYNQS